MNDKKVKLTRVNDIFSIAELVKQGKHIINTDIQLFHEEDDLIVIARPSYSVLRR